MAPTRETEQFLRSLQTFSGGKLTRQPDLGILMDAARSGGAQATLEQLSFHAKFAVKAYGIMQRIGRDGEGYDRLAAEFSDNITIVTGHLHTLLGAVEADDKTLFESRYLEMSAESLQNLLELLGDLAWYKNWLIDQRR